MYLYTSQFCGIVVSPQNLQMNITDVVMVGEEFTFTCTSTNAVPASVYAYGEFCIILLYTVEL